jgi:hypothetical protein
MGSLVLILMLIVSGAQADAEQITQQVQERQEEIVSLAEHAVSSYRKELDSRRLELEKKRLKLQHFEEHILELTEELEKLREQHERVASNTEDLSDQEQQNATVSQLEKQLAEAQEQLEELEKQPKGEKPIFAVIPYQGPNSTHRRPIYLECTAEGLRIQPEGNLLTLQDLKPPYGPGNPLDAALRAIRAEYKPANGAITHTAYPLLLVRPSGIACYALARSAMSGWDDQFGYELIEEELDLAFPPGKAGLDHKVEQAIALARERQAALVMAMPRRYQFDVDDLRPLSGGGNGDGTYANPSYPAGKGSQNFVTSDEGTSSSARSGNGQFGLADGGLANGNATGSPAPNRVDSTHSPGQAFSNTANSSSFGSSAALTGSDKPQSSLGSQAGNTTGGTGADFGSSSGGMAMPENSLAAGELSGESSRASNDQAGPDQSQIGLQGSIAGNESGTAAGMSSANLSSRNQQTTTSNSNSGGESSTMAGGQSGQAYPGQSSSMAMQAATGAASQAATNSEEPQVAPQLSANIDLSRQPEQARPVAARRGRDWAWSDGPRTQTPIVRPIYLQCYDDRWVVMPENRTSDKLVIPFEGTPEERASKLAEVVQARVQEWGFALAGGYWKPELVVDVSPDATWRYNQLLHLFEGSGLEIRQRTRTASRSEAP